MLLLTNNSDILAATSDPRDNRLIFSWEQNGQCFVEVQPCYNVGGLTFEVNGEITEILCTNPETGVNEPVGFIEAGGTQKIQMDLSRYLPKYKLSQFLRLAKQNCGLRVMIARGDQCKDPLDVNQFEILDVIGDVTWGAYSRTDAIMINKANAAVITESSTITGFGLEQVAKQNFTIRGELHVNPIVGIVICDKKGCGASCGDDSDGCQKVFTIDAFGIVGYSDDQLVTEAVLPAIPGFVGETVDLCCVAGQLVVVGNDGATGSIWYTTITSVFDGTPNWTQITTDVNAATMENFTSCQTNSRSLWITGETGTLYQYNTTTGNITQTTAVPGVTADFNKIRSGGSTVAIAGDSATLLISKNGGRGFLSQTVTDPATNADLDAGINITAVWVLNDTTWVLGLSDGRFLATVSTGSDWYEMLQENGSSASQINDLAFSSSGIGVAGMEDGRLLKTYYGACALWLDMPDKTDDVLPDHDAINSVAICDVDSNVSLYAGEAAGAGVVFLGTAEYI